MNRTLPEAWHHPLRILPWLLPVLAYLVGLCLLVSFQKEVGIGLAFPDDQSYQNMALARSISEHRTFGLASGQAVPACRDTLWVILLTFVRPLTNTPAAAVYLLGSVCACAVLFLLRKLVLEVESSTNLAGFTVFLAAVAPGLIWATASGSGAPLAMLLVTWAMWLHVRTVNSGVDRLPMLAAVMVGLLMWIRIEFIVLWLVFCLHAAIRNLQARGDNRNAFYLLIRGLNGLLLIGLSFFPLVAWNMALVKVPWPRLVGAPLMVETWGSTSVLDSVIHYFKLVSTSLPDGLAQWFQVGFTQSALATVLLLFSAVLITVLAVTRSEYGNDLVFPCVLLGVSALYGLVYPFVGWKSASIVFEAFTPTLIALTTLGLYRWPFLVRDAFVKRGRPAPDRRQVHVAWVVLATLLLGFSVVMHVVQSRNWVHDLNRKTEARIEVRRELMARGLDEGNLVTDEPGWLVYDVGPSVIDLTGLATPGVLNFLNKDGIYDSETLNRLRQQTPVDGWVLWDSTFRDVEVESTHSAILPDNPFNPRLLVEKNFSGR